MTLPAHVPLRMVAPKLAVVLAVVATPSAAWAAKPAASALVEPAGTTQPPASAAVAPPTAAAAAVPGATVAAPATPPPAAASPTVPAFGPDVMATADKPAGFAYSVMRDALVDEVQETYLYIKSSAKAANSVTVPVPKSRELLAKCIQGGGIEDLVPNAIVSVKYDPSGVVRPEIVIVKKVEVQVYDHARVLDRGGSKLYITLAEGGAKGFEVPGGAAAWDSVIEGGTFADLTIGTEVRIEHDPGGRQPIRVKILNKAAKKDAGGGCGCDARGDRGVPFGAVALGALLIGVLWRRRGVASR